MHSATTAATQPICGLRALVKCHTLVTIKYKKVNEEVLFSSSHCSCVVEI